MTSNHLVHGRFTSAQIDVITSVIKKCKWLSNLINPINLQLTSNMIFKHYIGVIMTTMASQIANLTVVYSAVYSDVDQRKHQSSASLAFVRGIHRRPVNSPHIWPVTRKMFPFDDVIMYRPTSHVFKHVSLNRLVKFHVVVGEWLAGVWYITRK